MKELNSKISRKSWKLISNFDLKFDKNPIFESLQQLYVVVQRCKSTTLLLYGHVNFSIIFGLTNQYVASKNVCRWSILTINLKGSEWSLPKEKKLRLNIIMVFWVPRERLTTTCIYTWKRLSYTYGSYFNFVGKSFDVILWIIYCRTEWYKTLVRYFSV